MRIVHAGVKDDQGRLDRGPNFNAERIEHLLEKRATLMERIRNVEAELAERGNPVASLLPIGAEIQAGEAMRGWERFKRVWLRGLLG